MFKLHSEYKPSGDQPEAIKLLVAGLKRQEKAQVLLGATGTGKTFTIANVIEQINKPTLILAHNKTLAGQLYAEFKELFPENRVEYFVSNFDYYQPEAYMPKTDTYIEKSSMTNDELDMLRMAAYNSLLERRDTIVIASVACIYASSNPDNYKDMFFTLRVNEKIERNELLMMFIRRQYTRNDVDQKRGTFKVTGDTIEVYLGHTDAYLLRIEMFDNEIERITEVDPITKKTLNGYTIYNVFPASGYARNQEDIFRACIDIENELEERLKVLESEGKLLEKQRLEQRCRYDIESLREFGMCSGVENYSSHIDGRKPHERPFNLFDYFPKDFLLVIDESHASIPQIRGMYNGDRARKETLVQYGFRLPSALDNRPMRFEEFEKVTNEVIYVSATPGNYELELVNHNVVQQIIRPTGLVDPEVEVRKSHGQIDNLHEEILNCIQKNQRVLITTLTVKMAEDLTAYLKKADLKVAHLHHEIKTLERIETIQDLRKGKIDVLVGINLLREGIDIPEVALVAILDADKEGFLRSERSLIQTIGRAARNSEGRVIMYADRMTDSMIKAIGETNRRREIQRAHNLKYGITPTTISKEIHEAIHGKETKEMARKFMTKKSSVKQPDRQALILELQKEMKEAARTLDFERAAELRDIVAELQNQ